MICIEVADDQGWGWKIRSSLREGGWVLKASTPCLQEQARGLLDGVRRPIDRVAHRLLRHKDLVVVASLQ